MLMEVVLGVYMVCAPSMGCASESAVFRNLNDCDMASTMVVEAIHQQNKQRKPGDQLTVVALSCTPHKVPPAGELN